MTVALVANYLAKRRSRLTLLRSLDRMDAAFRLGPAAPAARTRIFIRRGPAGAGHAPDRQVAGRCERMRRQFCQRVDRLDLFARDVCERIEFQPDAVLLDQRDFGAK